MQPNLSLGSCILTYISSFPPCWQELKHCHLCWLQILRMLLLSWIRSQPWFAFYLLCNSSSNHQFLYECFHWKNGVVNLAASLGKILKKGRNRNVNKLTLFFYVLLFVPSLKKTPPHRFRFLSVLRRTSDPIFWASSWLLQLFSCEKLIKMRM